MRNYIQLFAVFAVVLGFSVANCEAQIRRPLQMRTKLSTRVINRSAATAPVIAMQNGNWYPYTIARPADREWIRQTPMDQRPNRPLHFWGNSRRRMLR